MNIALSEFALSEDLVCIVKVSLRFRRNLSISQKFSSISQKFDKAKDQLNSLKNDPGNEVKLKMYALFKQVNLKKLYLNFYLSKHFFRRFSQMF